MKDFQRVHRIGLRLLKMIHSVDSAILPLHFLEAVFSVARIYVTLFLTAALIDLLQENSFEKAIRQLGMLLLAEIFLGIMGLLLKKRFRPLKTRLWLLFYVWLREKAFALDYETMENPESGEKILFSEKTADMHGGLGMVLYHYCEILRAFLHLGVASLLVAKLCLAKPGQQEGIWAGLAEPSVSLLLFGVALAGMAAGSACVYRKFAARQREIFEEHTGMENRMGYLAEQVFMNEKAGGMIRIYNMGGMLMDNAQRETEGMLSYSKKICEVSREESEANKLVNGIFSVLAALLAVIKTVAGAVSVGGFMRCMGAITQFGNACFMIVDHNGELKKICTYMQEFLAFLDMENLHNTGSIPVEKRSDGEYELAFEHVSFHYPKSRELVLKDVSCNIHIGGKMALVGKNGAGKTTFIKLLCRLYEPTEGRITLNGVDIRKYDEEEYQSLFAVVFQDFKLFRFSVAENIAAGYEREDERIWQALNGAGAKEMAEQMPRKLDSVLYERTEEGCGISGGQAQKLALARALYKNAPVIILDEPTAALDAKAEAEVYADFHKMMEGKTGIYISHRMSSCRFCDDIMVLDEGRIAERGSHEALLAAGGYYADMWNAQAKYYD